MEHQVAIRAALRLLFLHHRIEPFSSRTPDPEDTDQEEVAPELES